MKLYSPLSPQELKVLRLVTLGKKNKDIASELVIAKGTVEGHVRNIFRKLGATTRGEAAYFAMVHHLFDEST